MRGRLVLLCTLLVGLACGGGSEDTDVNLVGDDCCCKHAVGPDVTYAFQTREECATGGIGGECVAESACREPSKGKKSKKKAKAKKKAKKKGKGKKGKGKKRR